MGRPASYGCIRMRSRDVVKLFDTIGVGARISIINLTVSQAMREMAYEHGGALVAFRG